MLTTQVGFTQPGAFNMAGALNILPGAVVNVGSVTQIQNGTLTGGQWVLDSNLNITGVAQNIDTNNATVTLSGGTFKNMADGSDAFATLSQNGKTLRLMNSAKLVLFTSLDNAGQLIVGKGCKLIFTAGYGYTQIAGQTTNDGTLVSQIGINGGTVLGAGSVSGDLVLVGGTFSVGDAGKSALVQVTGTYYVFAGITSTGIGGTTVGTQYSQVKAGHAQLAGTLAGTAALRFYSDRRTDIHRPIGGRGEGNVLEYDDRHQLLGALRDFLHSQERSTDRCVRADGGVVRSRTRSCLEP